MTQKTSEQQFRIRRDRADEVQKIELATHDVGEIDIDTKLLNKLKRKMRRSRR